jgi:hypothetical protein
MFLDIGPPLSYYPSHHKASPDQPKGKPYTGADFDIMSIAHPKFRDDLLREAKNTYLI